MARPMVIINDFSTSVRKALYEIDKEWESYEGLIVCGTHSPTDVEKIIEMIREVREAGTPFLGICFGHQLASIEYAKNVLGIQRATSEEFYHKDSDELIVKKLPKLKVGLYPTNRMRLDSPRESYWNNYEVIDGFEELWKKADNFITCQYHPEYQSSKDNPHRLLVKFIESCKK